MLIAGLFQGTHSQYVPDKGTGWAGAVCLWSRPFLNLQQGLQCSLTLLCPGWRWGCLFLCWKQGDSSRVGTRAGGWQYRQQRLTGCLCAGKRWGVLLRLQTRAPKLVSPLPPHPPASVLRTQLSIPVPVTRVPVQIPTHISAPTCPLHRARWTSWPTLPPGRDPGGRSCWPGLYPQNHQNGPCSEAALSRWHCLWASG